MADPFATQVKTVEETPEPFRRALREHLSPHDSVRLLVFGPAYTSLGVRSPATLLAVSHRHWLIALDDEGGSVSIADCGFDDTLLVEITKILLYGRLKIDFIAAGRTQVSIIEFNTVMDKLYREAVQLILDGIGDGFSGAAADQQEADLSLETWPLKFRNAVPNTLPEGRPLLAAVHWPTIRGGFGRELAPAAALLATDEELILLSEETAWVWGPEQAKYGQVATYFPLVRLASFEIRYHGRFSILDLEMHASHGGEKLQFVFPSQEEQAVIQVVERALLAGGRQATDDQDDFRSP